MSALRRLWEGLRPWRPFIAGLMFGVVLHVTVATCSRDPAPLVVRGTLDSAGRFIPAGGTP